MWYVHTLLSMWAFISLSWGYNINETWMRLICRCGLIQSLKGLIPSYCFVLVWINCMSKWLYKMRNWLKCNLGCHFNRLKRKANCFYNLCKANNGIQKSLLPKKIEKMTNLFCHSLVVWIALPLYRLRVHMVDFTLWNVFASNEQEGEWGRAGS